MVQTGMNYLEVLIKYQIKLLIFIGILLYSSSIAMAVDIPVHAGDNLQTKINSASCGDTVTIDAKSTGAIFDGSFKINQICTAGNILTIRSSAHALLPSGRINPTDSNNLALLRTSGGGSYGEVLEFGNNAAYITIDGLELVDHPSTLHTAVINWLLGTGDSVGVNNITVQRTYFHQKETGTSYNRTVHRAISWEGFNMTMKWNYVHIIGYYYPEMGLGSTATMDTTAMLSVIGPGPINIIDNYINVWWNGIFLGGGDTLPQNIATLTDATTSSATFSNVTNLSNGIVIRMSLKGTGTYNAGTHVLTRVSGPSLNNSDAGWEGGGSTAIVLTPTGGGTPSRNVNLTTNGLSGNDYIMGGNIGSISCTICNWEVYETVKVTSVVGNIVNYTPFGINLLNHNGATNAAWNINDQGLINDVLVQKNTFHVDTAFAAHVRTATGNVPKGCFEIKNSNRMIVDGNRFDGYPCAQAFTGTNQNGTAPWIRIRNLTVTNNWIKFDLSTILAGQIITHGIAVTNNDYLQTTSPLINITISNNLWANIGNWIQLGSEGDNFLISHNTAISEAGPPNYNNSVLGQAAYSNFIFKDNIINYRTYGINCAIGSFDVCWLPASRVFLKNVVYNSTNDTGLNSSLWGTNSILSPIPTLLSQIGFTNLAADNYRLSNASSFHNQATDGTDPGINQNTLEAALSGAASATKCNWHTSSVCN